MNLYGSGLKQNKKVYKSAKEVNWRSFVSNLKTGQVKMYKKQKYTRTKDGRLKKL